MGALRLLFTAFLMFFAVLTAITVFLSRLTGRSGRNDRPVRPLERKRKTGETLSDEVIEVETTVVGADQGER